MIKFKNPKTYIIIILTILIVIFGVLYVKKPVEQAAASTEDGKVLKSSINETQLREELTTEILYGPENNITHDEVGNRINTSSKIKEEKKIEGADGLVIRNMNITASNRVTTITADVVNTSEEEKGNFMTKINFVDEDSRSIIEVGAYVNKVGAGKTVKLQTTTTIDFANAFNYTIKKSN